MDSDTSAERRQRRIVGHTVNQRWPCLRTERGGQADHRFDYMHRRLAAPGPVYMRKERVCGVADCALSRLMALSIHYCIVLHAHRAQSGVVVAELEPFFDGYIHILRKTSNDPLAPFLQSLPFAISPTFGSSPLSPRSATAISSLSRKGMVMISRGSSGAMLYRSTANYAFIISHNWLF